MYTVKGPCKELDSKYFLYKMHTEMGQSGSPLIKHDDEDRYVVGIHLGGWDSKKRNVALKLDEEKRAQIHKWIGYSIGYMNLSKDGMM